MKRYLLVIAAAAFVITAASVPTTQCQAQLVKQESKTITAADTITFNNVPSKVKSFTYNYTETSGTTAGKVYLEGSTITGSWDLIDSLTLSDVATLQKKTVTLTATSYKNYRWRNTNTSSATGAVKAAWLRRDDE